MQNLDGKRIGILATDGFEQVELTIPRTALRAAGARCDVISTHRGKIRGMNLHLPGRRIGVDRTLDSISVDDYDGLLIPGGFLNPDFLRQSAPARDFVRSFDRSGKPIASLCHGPWVLASAGLVEGRHLSSWPGIRDDLVNAGAIWHDAPAVRDRNWVTSRGPQDMTEFVRAITSLFAGEEPSGDEARYSSTESDPQQDEPPRWATAPLRLLTVPRVLLAAAATGAVIAAVRRIGDGAGSRRSITRRLVSSVA